MELKVLALGWPENKIKNLSASEIEFEFNTQKYAKNWRQFFFVRSSVLLSVCLAAKWQIETNWLQHNTASMCGRLAGERRGGRVAGWQGSDMSKYHLKVKQQALTAKDVRSRQRRDRRTAYDNFEYNSYAPCRAARIVLFRLLFFPSSL